MKRWLLAPLMVLSLACASDCEPAPPPQPDPQGGTDYCYGLEYTILDSVVQGVKGIYNTIIGGEPSTDRRATVQIYFGSAYCTGVVLSPHTVLTAGHCGYNEGLEHRIKLDGHSEFIISNESLVHPEYWKWINDRDQEGRKSDLMLLYTDEAIPGPYIPLTRIYESSKAQECYGLIAQGWGRDGDGKGGTLNESKYKITTEEEKYLRSRMTDVGKICFGDSGGPLYADVGPGELYLAGITTTTMSADCLAGGTHVKMSTPLHLNWIKANGRP